MPFAADAPLRLGFALEYSLGHATHAQNLKRALTQRSDILPTYVDLPFHNMPGAWAKLPGIRSNWSLRASLGAFLALRSQVKNLDALFFHTQVTSLFSTGLMRRLPSVISLDATPLQFDAFGKFYGHTVSSHSQLEALKKRLNRRAFTAAQHLIAWSQWTKDSLVTDYGVPAEKITVLPPGIDTALWRFDREEACPQEPLHILFVGEDFHRKGGDLLIDAFRRLSPSLAAVLHLVTNSPAAQSEPPGICVYRNLSANSEALLRLFRLAHLFVLPTRADCLPLAVMEAMAAGLPVITTSVGALPEAVTDGETGRIVPPDDVTALSAAMEQLAANPVMRLQMGLRAREIARERFDAATNYGRLVELLAGLAR